MTSFLDEFQANLELLPNMLQKKYALLRDLDKSLHEILRQNEQRCEQEIEYLKQELQSGAVTADLSRLKFSEEALDEQKHSIRIADEKVALAVQAYDLVDAHIQQLDQYLKKSEEENRREKELAAASSSSDAKDGNGAKSGKGGEGGRGRKKTRLGATAAAAAAAAAAAPVNPASMDLDLPVDPNEPTYCVCNQVSYGEMVGCDNSECRIEWFHFGCVGVKEKPKGKWYCPDCSGKQKRRKGK
ncbi:hypothetical protein vseg_005552 [Gypsophila vaccaria]